MHEFLDEICKILAMVRSDLSNAVSELFFMGVDQAVIIVTCSFCKFESCT